MKPKAYSYIRFSTPEQLKGDSLRRQLEASEKYAKEHDLELDTSKDLGVSGFTGEHRNKGALGKFLALVESGKIPKGSVLIVEHFDRLSREEILTALNQFTSIIQAGIKLVTLQDGMEYDKQSITDNWSQLIISITYMARAHEESKVKSERLKETWKHKRKKARNGKRKITGMTPAWLEISKDKESFIVKPEVAEAINLIFQMKLAGKGTYSIEMELNKMNVWAPPKSGRNKTGGWRKSYVDKILRNPGVHGEFQPHKFIKVEDEKTGKKKRKRVTAGEPIPDYYPEVVPKEIFNRTAEVLAHNRNLNGKGGGKTGKVSNLFTHIVKCGNCEKSSMTYQNKGEYQYLRCDRNRRGLGCDSETIRYDIFEPLMLHYIKGLNVDDVLPEDARKQSELTVLQNQLQSVNGEMVELSRKIENLDDAIADTDNKRQRERLVDKQDKFINKGADLEKEQTELERKVNRHLNAEQDTEKRLRNIAHLIERISDTEDKQQIDIRANLRQQLQRLLKRIDIKSGEFSYNGRAYRTIKLKFQDGSSRTIMLDEEDKLMFVEDKESGQTVTFWFKDGQVVGVDKEVPGMDERQREANRKVAKHLSKHS